MPYPTIRPKPKPWFERALGDGQRPPWYVVCALLALVWSVLALILGCGSLSGVILPVIVALAAIGAWRGRRP